MHDFTHNQALKAITIILIKTSVYHLQLIINNIVGSHNFYDIFMFTNYVLHFEAEPQTFHAKP